MDNVDKFLEKLALKEIEDSLGEIKGIIEMAMDKKDVKLIIGISVLLNECLEKMDGLE
jgi:hypothetical protein